MKILHPTDFSEGAAKAETMAVELARNSTARSSSFRCWSRLRSTGRAS